MPPILGLDNDGFYSDFRVFAEALGEHLPEEKLRPLYNNIHELISLAYTIAQQEGLSVPPFQSTSMVDGEYFQIHPELNKQYVLTVLNQIDLFNDMETGLTDELLQINIAFSFFKELIESNAILHKNTEKFVEDAAVILDKWGLKNNSHLLDICNKLEELNVLLNIYFRQIKKEELDDLFINLSSALIPTVVYRIRALVESIDSEI